MKRKTNNMDLTLKNILESLNLEARSNPELNPKETFQTFMQNLLAKTNFENLFVSFRSNIYVTDINPKNEYETPTGLYAYPLASYFTKSQLEGDVTDPNNNKLEQNFRERFPYQSDLKYMMFLNVKNITNLLTKSTPKEKLDEYVNKINHIYGNITPVHEYCKLFLNNEYQSPYKRTPYHDTHLFWLFLYSIAPYINKGGQKVTTITNICHKIGVDGFIDRDGEGYIHPAEKRQAVFFRVKGIADVYTYKDIRNPFKPLIRYSRDKKYMFRQQGEEIYMLTTNNSKLIKKIPGIMLDNSFSYYGFLKIRHPKSNSVNLINENGEPLSPKFYAWMESPTDKETIRVSDSQYGYGGNIMDLKGNLILPYYATQIIDYGHFYSVTTDKHNADSNNYDIYSHDGQKILSDIHDIAAPNPGRVTIYIAHLLNGKSILLNKKGIPITNELFDDINTRNYQRNTSPSTDWTVVYDVKDNDKGYNLLKNTGELLSPIWSKNNIVFNYSDPNTAIIQDPKTNKYNEIDVHGDLLHQTWSDTPKFNDNEINENLNRIKSIMGINEEKKETIPGRSVWKHIKTITPDKNDIPWGFQQYIIPRKFEVVYNFNLTSLLQTDPDFKEYYDSGEQRYHPDEIDPNDIHNDIVVVDGTLLDGYSRAATLLHNNQQTTYAYVAI